MFAVSVSVDGCSDFSLLETACVRLMNVYESVQRLHAIDLSLAAQSRNYLSVRWRYALLIAICIGD